MEAGDTPVLVHNCDVDFASERDAQKHFVEHVYGDQMKPDGSVKFKTRDGDMPEFKTADGFNEYVDSARTFMGGGRKAGDLIDGNGWLHRVDEATDRYGLLRPDGTIASYYRRKAGNVADYLEEQFAKYGGVVL